jgi:pSer/pThr/pTyr-binding forkhead associated (FHA) protein
VVHADGTAHDLGPGNTDLGAAPDNGIAITARGVSRHHARIWRQADGACWIEDLGSTNGTFVNGVRVTKEWLHDGDLITLGEWTTHYRAPTIG